MASRPIDRNFDLKQFIPKWLESESPEVPELYRHLWDLVKTPTKYADTQKVSQLLLTSGLGNGVLGCIWDMANNEVPGLLTKQEFFIILALVGLAQSGRTYNSLSVLNFYKTAPVPTLQTNAIENWGQSQSSISSSPDSLIRPFHKPPPVLDFLKSVERSTSRDAPEIAAAIRSSRETSEIKINKKSSKLSSTRDVSGSDSSRDFSRRSNFPLIGSSPTAELEDDDFSEFHSVSVAEPISNQRARTDYASNSARIHDFMEIFGGNRSIDPITLFLLTPKDKKEVVEIQESGSSRLRTVRKNVIKISPESEKKLIILTQPESLTSLPESKISSNNVVSTMPSISVVGGSSDIGMRLAHHSSDSRTETVRPDWNHFPGPRLLYEDRLSSISSESSDESFPKCFEKNSSASSNLDLRETKVMEIDNGDMLGPETFVSDCNPSACPYQPSKNTRKIEIPMLGTFNETTLPTQTESITLSQQPTSELFSFEEDKYSALRQVELEMKMKSTESQNKDEKDKNALDSGDDFGEFLTVDLPSKAPAEKADLWGERKDNLEPQPIVDNTTDSQKPLGDSNSIKVGNISNIHKETNSFEVCKIALNVDLLSLNEEDCSKTLTPTTEFDMEITEDRLKTKSPLVSVVMPVEEKLKGKEEVERKEVEGKTHEAENLFMLDDLKTNQTNTPSAANLQTAIMDHRVATTEDFGMSFATDATSTAPPITNVNESLRSLNPNVLPSEANANAIRRKCLTACLKLMQQAFEIFTGIRCPSILCEIFSVQETINYLNNLNIISHISKRTSSNCSELADIQEEIERLWETITNYCRHFNIWLEKDMDSDAPIGIRCYVCMGYIGKDIVEQGINSYHLSCANFWVNFVDPELPCPI